MWISEAGTILKWFSGAYLMRSSGHILLSLLPISGWLNRSLISWLLFWAVRFLCFFAYVLMTSVTYGMRKSLCKVTFDKYKGALANFLNALDWNVWWIFVLECFQIIAHNSFIYLSVRIPSAVTFRKNAYDMSCWETPRAGYPTTRRHKQETPDPKHCLSIVSCCQHIPYIFCINVSIIQRSHSKILRMIVDAPWYVSNATLHADLGISYVQVAIHQKCNKHHTTLETQENPLLKKLLLWEENRWLKRNWPSDLIWGTEDSPLDDFSSWHCNKHNISLYNVNSDCWFKL
jgi:hypothetical protein